MSQGKICTVLNLSSQGNVCEANQSKLSQFNYVVILGLSHLGREKVSSEKLPLSIKITKGGELEINGLSEDTVDDPNNIKIHSDKKITNSE